MSALRRLIAASMARELNIFVIPGPEIARAHGLDIAAAGIQLVVSPRHASVLLVIGAIPPALRETAAVIYAQMMRPRVLFAVGTEDLWPLPPADVVAGLSQQELVQGLRQLRIVFAEGAFHPDVSDFDAPVLQTRIEYSCPMHAEVIQDEPGACPKCGMNLVPREAQTSTEHNTHTDRQKTDTTAHMQTTSTHDHNNHHEMDHAAPIEYTCPMHAEIVQDKPGACPKCGMNLVPREAQTSTEHNTHTDHQKTDTTAHMQTTSTHDHNNHHEMDHDAPVEYTCPMHPEIVQDKPGACPKCGMNLEPRETQDAQHQEHARIDHSTMNHDDMNHDDMTFMSMIDVTKDLPRSSDGLPMEWIDTPFGPFFPGLPGGLLLTLTLDGDTVTASHSQSLIKNSNLLPHSSMDTASFIKQLTDMDPLSPVAYQLLGCRALEHAAGIDVHADTGSARAAALERERIASHLNWLSLFGQQIGFDWLMQRAASLQLKIQHADLKQIVALRSALQSLINRLQRTPLLKSRTLGIGQLAPAAVLHGPVARACGISNDARSADKIFSTLGFTPANRKEGDAFARLQVRLDEMTHSLTLIEAAGVIERPAPVNIGDVSASGESVVETPRGLAHLQLTLQRGQVTAAQLETPSTSHLSLIDPLTRQHALGDALMSVCSLDLSPWEIQQ